MSDSTKGQSHNQRAAGQSQSQWIRKAWNDERDRTDHDSYEDAGKQWNELCLTELLQRVAQDFRRLANRLFAAHYLNHIAELQPQARHRCHLDIAASDPRDFDTKSYLQIQFRRRCAQRSRVAISILDPLRNWGLGLFHRGLSDTTRIALGVFHAGDDQNDSQTGDGSTVGIKANWNRQGTAPYPDFAVAPADAGTSMFCSDACFGRSSCAL